MGSERSLNWGTADATRILGMPKAARDTSDAPDYWRIGGRSWPEILNSMRWPQEGEIARFAGNAPLITGDHPRTEYYLMQQTFGSQYQRPVTTRRLRQLPS